MAEGIGIAAIENGFESYIAAAYTNRPSQSIVIKIGGNLDRKLHGLKTRLCDRHGFGSKRATKKLISSITEIKPDIIHMHNIHGYYLNIDILFTFLKKSSIPVVWTLHDCWPFTGHCSYFDAVNCMKWQTECHHCPNRNGYPKSWFVDNSRANFHKKKELFNGIENLTIVVPSKWLSEHVKFSFLKSYPVLTIYNGVDIDVFRPLESETIRQKYGITGNKIVLGVASVWDWRKGLNDFFSLRDLLGNSAQIVLVGLSSKQIKVLSDQIIGIKRTENISDLAAFYSAATVFINPTYVDNFPTTNIEALACGTPVVTYNTGGSPEALDNKTGIVVKKGDLKQLFSAVQIILENGKEYYTKACRKRAEEHFSSKNRYMDYLNLYKEICTPLPESHNSVQ